MLLNVRVSCEANLANTVHHCDRAGLCCAVDSLEQFTPHQHSPCSPAVLMASCLQSGLRMHSLCMPTVAGSQSVYTAHCAFVSSRLLSREPPALTLPSAAPPPARQPHLVHLIALRKGQMQPAMPPLQRSGGTTERNQLPVDDQWPCCRAHAGRTRASAAGCARGQPDAKPANDAGPAQQQHELLTCARNWPSAVFLPRRLEDGVAHRGVLGAAASRISVR